MYFIFISLVLISIFIVISILLQKSSNMGLGAYESDINSKLNLNDSFLRKITGIFILIWIGLILYINFHLK